MICFRSNFGSAVLGGLAGPSPPGVARCPPTSRVSAPVSTSRCSVGSASRTSRCTRSATAVPSATARSPAGVTAMILARRSALDGRRSARPAFSMSSTVTTIVVLSRSEISASSIWVRSACSAWNSTQYPRGVRPISPMAADIWVASTWLAWFSRKDRSRTVLVGTGLVGTGMPRAYQVGLLSDYLLMQRFLAGDCLLHECPAEVPHQATTAVRVLHDVGERVEEQRHLRVPDVERRQQLDELHVVTGDLGQNPVLLEQGDDHHLRDQAVPRRLQHVPAGAELQRARLAQLEAEHQAAAAPPWRRAPPSASGPPRGMRAPGSSGPNPPRNSAEPLTDSDPAVSPW